MISERGIMMGFGFTGNILRVDLSEGKTWIERKEDAFYRKYMGGSAIGTYYLLTEMPRGADPLGPDNLLVFSLSVLTGGALSGLSRYNLTAKSPLTGAIGDAQSGGWFPAELKFAGFDAIVIKGKAEKPVYLYITDGKAEIRDAEKFWGQETLATEKMLREEIGDKRVRIAAIGPAGENLVKYACVLTEGKFAAGRTGMGTVMGSKNLKAIAVRGDRSSFSIYDKNDLKDLARETSSRLKDSAGLTAVSKLGSAIGVTWEQAGDRLPTNNFQSGTFPQAETIGGEYIFDNIHTKKRETCYSCGVLCKQVVSAEKPYKVNPEYGAPEYETLAMLGSNVGVGDPVVVAHANELCNRFSLDTISVGAMISFVMECTERGLLTKEQTDGIDCHFGNGQALIELIKKIAHREGIGDILADGFQRAIQYVGQESEKYALHVKWNPFPAHEPRAKRSLALAYAMNPFGADHVSSNHDPMMAPGIPEQNKEALYSLGIHELAEIDDMKGKARFFYYTQMQFSINDTLSICGRALGLFGHKEVPRIVKAITGWNTNQWELMKVGERRFNMMRVFNAREGFTRKNDNLPPRMFEPMKGGSTDGVKITKKEMEQAMDEYFNMVGWDKETGNPTTGKLAELGLDWLNET